MNINTDSKYKVGLIKTISFDGIDVFETLVECQILPGIPAFSIVGLGDKTINEAKERVKSALFSCGFQAPLGKIIINLSPANRFKEGSHYDLPIIMSILVAMGEIQSEKLKNCIFMSELNLKGDLLPVHGILPAVIFCKKHNYTLVSSILNQEEMVLPIQYFAADNLINLIKQICNTQYFHPVIQTNNYVEKNQDLFSTIYGQDIGKRALIIAAAGRHNIMFIGTKGIGKSMLSRSIIDLLPDLSENEALETTSIHSIAGELNDHKLLYRPPFRSPHSSSSLVSLIGGGAIPRPGEISLAHNGVLFLDELPEFQLSVIDSLRTPIEDGLVNIARSKYKITYPANFQLIVSMNPCKCGNLFTGNCKCKQRHYMYKVSAPIQDRIDIKIVLEVVDFSKKNQYNMKELKQLICDVRKKQITKFDKYNSDLSSSELENNGGFTDQLIKYIQNICVDKKLSGRSYVKTLSVARTIADLDRSDIIEKHHINEAIFFVASNFD
jgi:magnesium chelatase family protein